MNFDWVREKSNMISIIGLRGIHEIRPGDDLGFLILRAAEEQGIGIRQGDIIVVTQKVVSKTEGRLVNLDEIEPSDFAEEISRGTDRDPRHTEAILRESSRIIKMREGILITETRHGFVCANAGVDRSNIEEGLIALLPLDPDKSALRIHERIKELSGEMVAVIITDTWGRPWRLGQVDFAIGVAGMSPFRDYRGETDPYGYLLGVTNIAVADELSAAAELAKGKLKGIPVVIIRGYEYEPGEGYAKDMLRPLAEDLFR